MVPLLRPAIPGQAALLGSVFDLQAERTERSSQSDSNRDNRSAEPAGQIGEWTHVLFRFPWISVAEGEMGSHTALIFIFLWCYSYFRAVGAS